jgi:hypothetical protein
MVEAPEGPEGVQVDVGPAAAKEHGPEAVAERAPIPEGDSLVDDEVAAGPIPEAETGEESLRERDLLPSSISGREDAVRWKLWSAIGTGRGQSGTASSSAHLQRRNVYLLIKESSSRSP